MSRKTIRFISIVMIVACIFAASTCNASALTYKNSYGKTGFNVCASNTSLISKKCTLVIKSTRDSDVIYITPVSIPKGMTIRAGAGAGLIGLKKTTVLYPGNSATFYISVPKLTSGLVKFKVENATGGAYSYSFNASGACGSLGKCLV